MRRYAEEIPGYSERLRVKPGLTGLAQVNGEYHTSPAYKLKYDLAYIYNYSLVLDLKIMAETVKVDGDAAEACEGRAPPSRSSPTSKCRLALFEKRPDAFLPVRPDRRRGDGARLELHLGLEGRSRARRSGGAFTAPNRARRAGAAERQASFSAVGISWSARHDLIHEAPLEALRPRRAVGW